MKIIIAKVNGVEVDRKTVKEANPYELHAFRIEAARGVNKNFREDIKISVKDGKKVLSSIISDHFTIK